MTAAWRSYHLFRSEPWESFLAGVVWPFVSSSISDGVVESFFFVRYWDRGPHIRLRLKSASGAVLDDMVDRSFGDYFRRCPSVRIGTKESWLPNDTVQKIAYEPETERYGGADRLALAEEQFEASSRAVLAIVGEGDWSYQRALGAAIQLHLILFHAFRFDLAAAKEYFDGMSAYLLPFGNPLPSAESMLQFAAAFERQRDLLTSVHSAAWSALEEDIEFDQEWANRWRGEMTRIGARLRGTRTDLDTKERAIIGSLIHMTNNRLGVRNHDEAFLLYLMNRSLESMNERVA